MPSASLSNAAGKWREPNDEDKERNRTMSEAVETTETNGAGAVEAQVVDVLKTCYDPEIPVDIYELGLVYRVEVDDAGKVEVDMTLTSPACPVAGTLPPEVEAKINRLDAVSSVQVDLVWDPPWNPDRMTDAAKLRLGLL